MLQSKPVDCKLCLPTDSCSNSLLVNRMPSIVRFSQNHGWSEWLGISGEAPSIKGSLTQHSAPDTHPWLQPTSSQDRSRPAIHLPAQVQGHSWWWQLEPQPESSPPTQEDPGARGLSPHSRDTVHTYKEMPAAHAPSFHCQLYPNPLLLQKGLTLLQVIWWLSTLKKKEKSLETRSSILCSTECKSLLQKVCQYRALPKAAQRSAGFLTPLRPPHPYLGPSCQLTFSFRALPALIYSRC